MFSNQYHSQGISLVEVLISITILVLVSSIIYSAFAGVIKLASISKARVGAWSLANQKIETFHNLPYDEVGVVGGVPSGPIPQDEDVSLNGINYHIHSTVLYYDDPADSISTDDGGNDDLPNDYKKIKVTVSWNNRFPGQISSETTIAPKGLETDAGGGTLRIKVFDASGNPVDQANVKVENSQVDPSIDATYLTNSSGTVTLFGAPTSTEGYNITVTKDSYSTDQTYTTNQVASPNKPPASVDKDQLTEISFSIDQLSQFNITTKKVTDLGTSTYANAKFILSGSKTIGTDDNDNPVLKFSKSYTSDSNGQISISNLEWDSYNFSAPAGTYLDISSTSPAQPVDLLPTSTQDVTIYFKAQNSLTLTVLDASSSDPIFGATAHLYNSDGSYDQNQLTNSDGQTEFWPLAPGDYNLDVTMDNYQTSTSVVSVSGHTSQKILLTHL